LYILDVQAELNSDGKFSCYLFYHFILFLSYHVLVLCNYCPR